MPDVMRETMWARCCAVPHLHDIGLEIQLTFFPSYTVLFELQVFVAHSNLEFLLTLPLLSHINELSLR